MRPMMNRIMLLNLNLLLTFSFISDLIQISSTVLKLLWYDGSGSEKSWEEWLLWKVSWGKYLNIIIYILFLIISGGGGRCGCGGPVWVLLLFQNFDYNYNYILIHNMLAVSFYNDMNYLVMFICHGHSPYLTLRFLRKLFSLFDFFSGIFTLLLPDKLWVFHWYNSLITKSCVSNLCEKT